MKALVLLSGGLDSCLAAAILREQGVEVEALNFQTPFCQAGSTGGSCGDATRIASEIGVPLRVFHLGQQFMNVVARPKHGWGKNMNPCIDCRILMLQRAKEYMSVLGASFVATGEVLGQRPLSQHMRALSLVERESGLGGLILRPLSARALGLTIPETKGWVDRERLLNVTGRSRKEQFALARRFGIRNPPTPAGGCLLTDPAYSRRLKDALQQTGSLTTHLAQILRFGRYCRFPDGEILIVGRNQEDNMQLSTLRKDEEWLLEPVNCVGPTALGTGPFPPERLEQAAAVLARYSDRPASGRVKVRAQRGGEEVTMDAAPLEPEAAGAARF